jgi:antagonist of KipI
MSATAIRSGFVTTVQDLGRVGFREFGVSLGGALDPHALRVANLLAGNEESAAGLEITFGGLRLRFSDERVVVWCGGEFKARIGSTPIDAGHPALVRSDEELSIEPPALGCRAWLAISGGIDVPLVLGSRATDLRAGFGGVNGRVLRDGDKLPLSENPPRAETLIAKLHHERVGPWKPPHDWSSPARRAPSLRYIRGSDSDRFVEAARQLFTTGNFFVSPDSDRMGIRLEGPELERKEKVDLLSEAVGPGTVQVPPNGKPILLLNDCQTIGGYPKIAHVITVDLPAATQLCSGNQVRFVEIPIGQAHALLLERARNLEQFRRGLELHFK